MNRDLYSRAFEAGIFPVLDRLNGTSIVSKLKFLVDSERRDPEDIRRSQEDALERVLSLAREKNAFYRRHWDRKKSHGLPSEYQGLDGLPLVTKDDLKSDPALTRSSTFSGRSIASRTSGSTGSPMVFLRTMEQESWFWALRFRIWRWAGYSPGDPYLTINLNPRLGWKKHLQDRLFRCAYLTFNADNQDSEKILETLERKRIPFLNGFSSSLYVLSRFMLEHDARNPDVRGITSTGDTLFEPYREAIESAFGVRVLDYYGAGGEGVHLASQCLESGSRYHLHPENAIVEILGEDGPVSPGQRGRIIVTQLHNEAMPLIRYDLEDVAVRAPDRDICPCGRTLPMLERIEGRVPDLVSVSDGSFLVMHFFVVLFKNLQEIERYQVLQTDLDHVVFRLVGRSGAQKSGIEKTIREQVSEATRGLLGCKFDWVESIPLSGDGKRRLVISEVSRSALRVNR